MSLSKLSMEKVIERFADPLPLMVDHLSSVYEGTEHNLLFFFFLASSVRSTLSLCRFFVLMHIVLAARPWLEDALTVELSPRQHEHCCLRASAWGTRWKLLRHPLRGHGDGGHLSNVVVMRLILVRWSCTDHCHADHAAVTVMLIMHLLLMVSMHDIHGWFTTVLLGVWHLMRIFVLFCNHHKLVFVCARTVSDCSDCNGAWKDIIVTVMRSERTPYPGFVRDPPT